MATAKKDLTDTRVQGLPSERLLSVRDVAERLSVSTKTVYRLKSEGQIGFIKVGGSLRFREKDVTDFENRGSVTPHRYAPSESENGARLNLKFEVKKRGRGPRRR
jgi:excisionase family DNA binding protein